MLRQLQRDNLAAFRKLLACLETERPLALVGAGLAMRAGYPSWDGLIHQLHTHSGIADRIGPGRAEFIRTLDDPLFRADLYRRELRGKARDDVRYFRFLRKTFKDRGPVTDPTLRRFVGLNFGHILTTNYDPTLQLAHKGDPPAVIEWQADAAERDVFITTLGAGRPNGRCVVHLHGIWSDPKNIVLTDGDYLDRYIRQEEARRLLFAIFATKSVVFVGFGLRDPDLMQLLRSVASSLSARRGRHFALLSHDPSREDAALVRERLVHKFDINPVFYPATKTHGLLEKLILALHRKDETLVPDFTKRIPEGHRSPAADPPPPAPPAGRPAKRRRPPVTDPDDPQKGRWGGKPERNGRRLTASVTEVDENWYQIELRVAALKGAPDLAGRVTFHLHDTFPEMNVTVPVSGGRSAELTKYAYGAFTVGADVRGEATELELDLAKLRGAPRAFREA